MTSKNTITPTRPSERGRLVYSTSDHLGSILVKDYRDYRVLTFDSDYTQSGYNLLKPYSVYHDYIRIMMLVLGWATPSHITLLGLGGGSLLRSLHHHLERCEFSIVELRAEVIKVAQNFFDLPITSREHYTCSDANAYLSKAPKASSDIIFSDLFDAYLMSPTQVKPAFLTQCQRVLRTDGWLVINFHHLPLERSVFYQTLRQYFPKVFVYSCEADNHILFACKTANLSNKNALEKIAKMERELSTPFLALFERLQGIMAG